MHKDKWTGELTLFLVHMLLLESLSAQALFFFNPSISYRYITESK